jgi:hypothetical protein
MRIEDDGPFRTGLSKFSENGRRRAFVLKLLRLHTALPKQVSSELQGDP